MNDIQTIEDHVNSWLQRQFEILFPEEELDASLLQVVPTTNEQFGDYQCNAAMGLARSLKKSPRDIAGHFADKAVLPESLDRIEIAGPGFINLFLSDAWLEKCINDRARSNRQGVPMVGSGRKIIIDYSSPNVAKPMHIGHIRSTVIGNAIDRMLRFLGYEVIADNHLGDWGTQFGLLIMGYQHFVDKATLAERPVEELERIYVESYNRAQEDDEWMQQARSELVKLQQGDAENVALWKQFIEWSLQEFEHIYKRLDVQFDTYRGESYYNSRLPQVVDRLKKAGLAEVSEGAQIVNLEDEGLGVCIIQKRDGGYNYATSDLATVLSRVEEFKPQRIIYVTDERQQLHFRQFFNISGKLGVEVELIHVWFGLMRLPEGTFSTRQGNVIKLEKMLDEAEERAMHIVQENSKERSEEEQRAIARTVGIGAVKYADLCQNPQSLVTFEWKKALAMDGNSAPYLQYAYARICSVLDKYAAQATPGLLERSSIVFSDSVERRIALKLLRFPAAVTAAAEKYRPNILADYLFELAQLYSTFYQTVPFLKAPEGVRESRLLLCKEVASTLKCGLHLFGIGTLSRI